MHELALKLTWVSLLNELEGQVWSLLVVVCLHFLVCTKRHSVFVHAQELWLMVFPLLHSLSSVCARSDVEVELGLEVLIFMLDRHHEGGFHNRSTAC